MRPRWLPWLVLVAGLAIVVWTRRHALTALVDSETRVVTAPRLTGVLARPDSKAAPTPMVPGDNGACPASHPVKANPSSRIYHLPHHRMYHRLTNAVCYVDEQTAEAEGYRVSKQ
jgi:hypothetical protein